MTVHLVDPTCESKLWADLVRENKERKARMFAGAVEQKPANSINAPTNIIEDEHKTLRAITLNEAIARWKAQEQAKKLTVEEAHKRLWELEEAVQKATEAVQKATEELRAFKERVAMELNPPPTIQLIKEVVIEHFKIPLIEMTSKKRSASVVLPRQIAMYLVHALTPRTLPEIGRKFGRRDHTTILHGIRSIAAKMAADEELRATVEHLRDKINPPATAIAAE